MTLHNDLPTLDDKLGWADELDRLAQRIQACPTPHVLGIHGDWGSGKTSFMRQLQWRLGGEMPEDGSVASAGKIKPLDEQKKLSKEIATIWFDAWRYQNEPAPVVALLQEMRRQMAALPAVMEKMNKLGAVGFQTIYGQLERLSSAAKWIGMEGILPSAEQIQKSGERWEQQHHADTLPSDSLRDHLQQAIKQLLPDSERARVVVFIDDLDRCNPKAAFRLLEGLKIYLSVPNCVFILGMNERILVDAIQEEISAPDGTLQEELQLRAAHYLEKICTDINRLPLPHNPLKLLGQWLPDKNQAAILAAAVGDIACLPPNPRRIKALANQWAGFERCLPGAASKEAEYRAASILIAAYIHQFHRDLWERWHFNPEFWGEIKAWCHGERSGNAPAWSQALLLTGNLFDAGDSFTTPTWRPSFSNPGDIRNFWIDALIRAYGEHLTAKDFVPLLRCRQASAGGQA